MKKACDCAACAQNHIIKPNATHKCLDGMICNTCYSGLPTSVKKSILRFSAADIAKIREHFFQTLVMPEEDIITFGEWKVDAWIVDRALFEFVPDGKETSTGKTHGTVVLKLQLIEPKMALCEPVAEESVPVICQYGEQVALLPDCYREKEEEIMEKARRKREKMACEKERARRYSEYIHNAFSQEEARREEEERRERERRNRERSENQRREEQRRNARGRQESDRLHDALVLFGMSMPFTMAELKSRRNMLMKAVHEDAGGDKEYAQKVNAAFDLLKSVTDG